jgi:hypothetical protein
MAIQILYKAVATIGVGWVGRVPHPLKQKNVMFGIILII